MSWSLESLGIADFNFWKKKKDRRLQHLRAVLICVLERLSSKSKLLNLFCALLFVLLLFAASHPIHPPTRPKKLWKYILCKFVDKKGKYDKCSVTSRHFDDNGIRQAKNKKKNSTQYLFYQHHPPPACQPANNTTNKINNNKTNTQPKNKIKPKLVCVQRTKIYFYLKEKKILN